MTSLNPTHSSIPINKTNTNTTTHASGPVISGLVATLLSGAIFGFFYAWVCSTMWAFDATDPRVAIEAMQAVNLGVRNMTFFPSFFLTPFALLIAAWFSWRSNFMPSAKLFAGAGLIYLLFGLILTMVIVVPLNNELAEVVIPESIEAADLIWTDYSASWQFWNITRTIFCGISLALASLGLINITVAGSR